MDLKYLSFFGVETVRLWDCDSVKPEPRMSHKIQKISTADIKTGFIKKSNNNNLIYPQVNSTRETVPFNFFFWLVVCFLLILLAMMLCQIKWHITRLLRVCAHDSILCCDVTTEDVQSVKLINKKLCLFARIGDFKQNTKKYWCQLIYPQIFIYKVLKNK